MASNKKLSTYLNGYYSYHKIKDAESKEILDIAFEYIQSAEDKIFKQPAIALRAIKVEMIDILIHHDKYVKELEAYINELNAIVSKGPRLDDSNLEKAKALEEKRNVLVEFVYLIENSLSYMMRMLLENYSELEKDKPFLDKFSKYLSPFDWLSERAERFRSEFIMHQSNNSKIVSFERQIINQAKELIKYNKVIESLDLLLSKAEGLAVENDLILLRQQWVANEIRSNLGLEIDASSTITRNRIVFGILSIIGV